MRPAPKNGFTLAIAALALAIPAMAQSTPAFAPPTTWAAAGTSAIAAGDMNGDGRLDVITAHGAGGSHGVSVLLSNGDGTFQPAANFITNTDPTGIVAGDFNGDGKLDIAVANKANNTLNVLLGNGDGTLQQATIIPLSTAPYTLMTSDINSDGKADLVVVQVSINPATGAATILGNILLSNGDGSFNQATFPMNGGMLVLGDFNGDGKTDFFTYATNPVQAVPTIRFGNGDGTFTNSPLPFATNGLNFLGTNMVTGDFNGDGFLDIYTEYVVSSATRSPAGFSETMALGHGDGTFTVVNLPGNTGLDGQNMIVGDFNRDGKLDVAGIFPGPLHFSAVYPPPYQVKVLYGNGDGTLAAPVSFPAGSSASVFTGNPLVSADFDGNGTPDFALATTSGVNLVRNANGNPPLLSKLTLNTNWVVGGATNATATLTLGDPAPATGVQVTLNSSNPAAASFPGGAILTIPAGATSATFTVSTSVVAAAGLVTVTASANGVNQLASFNVVPAYVLSSVATDSPSAFGWFGGGNGSSGTINLSTVAIDGVVVTLTSSNPGLVAVTPSVTIPAGTTSASFAALISNRVLANTPVTITATLDGVSKTYIFTVLTASDTITITKAQYLVKNNTWTIEGTASNPAALIRVLTTAGGGTASPFGGQVTIRPSPNGSFKGQGVTPPPFTAVVLQSTLGGYTTGPVSQK